VKPESGGAFAYFDGDDVGATIELLLLQSDVASAAEVSSRVSEGIRQISDHLEAVLGGTVFFAAGDEVLAHLDTPLPIEEAELLRDRFHDLTGLSISCGVAETVQNAAHQLRLAKLRGKDQTAAATDG
jgi:hypothetical protein